MDFNKLTEDHLQEIDQRLHSQNHIESFDYFLGKGLKEVVKGLSPIEIYPSEKQKDFIRIVLQDLQIGRPDQLPFSARLTHSNYSANLLAVIKISINDDNHQMMNLSLGSVPIMVLSQNCLLKDKILKDFKEDPNEVGGFFIVNGLEKILRNLIIPRKNYPMGIVRPTFTQRRNTFTEYGVMIKCSHKNYLSQSLTLHYTTNNSVYLSIMIKKVEYLFPLGIIVKGLVDLPDLSLIQKLEIKNSSWDPVVILQEIRQRGLQNRSDCLKYLGLLMRQVMRLDNQITDERAGEIFLQKYILIHLDQNLEKVRLLSLMVRKLWLLSEGQLQPENQDSLTMQEILTAGQLYGMYFREKMEEVFEFVKAKFIKDLNKNPEMDIFQRIRRGFELSPKVGTKLENLLSTGNIKSNTGLDLMQNSGYSIIAERLNNMRFWSHLRSVHRGAYFVEMKTTGVRKLLPDSWGYLCPVHTPDGTLCGLLNHLAMGCQIQNQDIHLEKQEWNYFMRNLIQLGLNSEINGKINYEEGIPVVMDGKVLGWLRDEQTEEFVQKLRKKTKSGKNSKFTKFQQLSITLVPKNNSSQVNFPMIYLSLSQGRPLRKVLNKSQGFMEIIDALEQSYMMIATNTSELKTCHTHIEIAEDLLLSELSAQTPYLVHNQSPRDMYQCQMAKQTMGTPSLTLSMRNDNKMYTLNTPQKPLLISRTYDQLGFDDYPSGENAVIAVLSYTGYDIEDAMIINKASYERGFMHGRVQKTTQVDFSEGIGRGGRISKQLLNGQDQFAMQREIIKGRRVVKDQRVDINDLIEINSKNEIEIDGMPTVGNKIKKGDVQLSYFDPEVGKVKNKFYKDNEQSQVSHVYVSSMKDNRDKVNVTLKKSYNRNPVVGDKFSSRHGQKGVMGILWPQIDMPFSESGITPDLIINPNAFPSRMTIGMLIECLSGKNLAMRGESKEIPSYDRCDMEKIGEELAKFGFNKMGTETLYSGVYGVPLKAQIFQGIVYYQRLRHMIKDKAQARSTGPIDCLTRQPIKGRKKGGGIRFGEMERDALIAHGVSFIMKERLLNSSDKHIAYLCTNCNTFLTTFSKEDAYHRRRQNQCIKCVKNQQNPVIKKIEIPYVLRFLVNELAAMNIKLDFRS